ncbi:hypothetical protein AB3662_48305 [Sorangium cellulosum]|uniref:hypothetical protein n=1 Tax=Sorangium cellulosum TaxID=56 RepID=UPI003D9A3F79
MVATAPRVQVDDFSVRVLDAQGAPVIAGEIKSRPQDRRREILQLQDLARAARFPYALFVDLKSAQLFDLSEEPDAQPIFELPTRALLDAYASGIGEDRVLGQYLQRIVDTWFRNILFPIPDHPTPPGVERLRELGLLSRVEGGEARVALGDYF